MTCWILTDGRTGTENNARGLAESLGLEYEIKRIELNQPWKTLSPWLRCGLSHAFKNSTLTPPWPDIVITAGRTPAVGSLYIGQKNPGSVRIHITNPGIGSRHFDLVITPEHDAVTSSNIITTAGALHRVTQKKLDEARVIWEPRFAHMKRPWHGVLVGGDAHGLRLDPATAGNFMTKINSLGGSSIVTASRRTSDAARTEISRTATYLWDGTGDNPYLGILACADDLFVTSDSVSMISEAAFTGKPVWLLELPGRAPKLERFRNVMLARQYIARFDGSAGIPQTVRLDDMAMVTAKVRELLVARGKLSQ